MPVFSNPFAQKKDKKNAATTPYTQSESWGTRLRDRLISPFFYNKDKAFSAFWLIGILGIILATLPWILGVAAGIALGASVVGGLVVVSISLALYINSYLFGWEDTDTALEFKELDNQKIYNETGELMGSARLKYNYTHSKKAPQLTIKAEDHFKAGYIQGYTLGAQGDKLLTKLKAMYKWLRVFNLIGYKIPAWGHEDLQKAFFNHLPGVQRQEIEGLVKGHNHWAKLNNKAPITINDLVMLHLLPDVHNIKQLFKTGEFISTGCTAGLIKQANGKIIHFRNTDWPSYNEAQKTSIVTERHIGENEHSRTVGFPLCIGVEYGENEYGLTLSINVSPGGSVFNPEGKLAFLLYRELLQTCRTVDDVLDKIKQDKNFQPVGPCQLTISDKEGGAIVRFYQAAYSHTETKKKDQLYFPSTQTNKYQFTHGIERLSNKNPVLVVANEGFMVEQNGDLNCHNYHDTRQRQANVLKKLSEAPRSQNLALAHAALQSPLVNNCESVHTIIKDGNITFFTPANGYSARHELVSLGEMSTQPCFTA